MPAILLLALSFSVKLLVEIVDADMGALKVTVMAALMDTLGPTGLLAVTVGAVRPVLVSVLPPPPPHPVRLNIVKVNKMKPFTEILRNIIEYPMVGHWR